MVWLHKADSDALTDVAEAWGVSRTKAIALLIKRAVSKPGQTTVAPKVPKKTRPVVEDDDEQPAKPALEPGSPGDLAARVRAKAKRREAVIVASGVRVSEGRERRQ